MMSSFKRRAIKLWRGGWHSHATGNDSDGSAEFRTIHCNQRSLNANSGYGNNKTSTTKYTWYTFLPLSLFVQYRRAAYWYFTAMAALSLTPLGPYTPVSVVLPLLFVLALGLGREFWEDFRRSRGDRAVNARPARVFLGGRRAEIQWKDLQVGDLVQVTDGEYFPADLLLLSAGGIDGVCYVETKNLDGETNLKARQALEPTWNLKDEAALRAFRAEIKCEGPNASLYTFTGRLEMQDGQSFPLGPDQLLLRDSSLQNTGQIWGVAVYTGHDTKVMQNATTPPSKRSRIDRTLDKIIYAMFAILLIMSAATGFVLGYRTRHDGPDLWYLSPYQSNPYYNPNDAVVAGLVSAVTGLVLYGYLIPIALYVTLEIVRVIQGLYMMQDLNMYDPATDRTARVKSIGLNEELGQVDTILSDKTGTLTCNQMDFFRCSIAGVSYGRGTTEVERATKRLGVALAGGVDSDDGAGDVDGAGEEEHMDESGSNPYYEKGFNFYDSRLLGGSWVEEPNAETIRLFFQILAVCHTAIPEGKVEEPTSMNYRAESPDEAALVVAAKQFGFCFYKRTPSAVYVREGGGQNGQYTDRTYQLLNVLEFSSARKRMSVIVRFPEGRLMLLSKGADSVMASRVDNGNRRLVKTTLQHLKQYAEVGLRTLVLAYRELDEAEYEKWNVKFSEARSVLGREREQKTEEVMEEIERKLVVVGGTGVEDKLQVGVPETIDNLARAGINIWVLTGDKVETAINIGYACSLLRHGMEKIIISLDGPSARNVEERAEAENLSRDEVNKELTNLVAQQLSEGFQEMERMKSAKGESMPQDFSGENGGQRQSLSRSLSRSISGSLFRSLSRRPSGYQGDQEMKEVKDGSSLRRKHENGEASLLRNLNEEPTNQENGLGPQPPSSKERPEPSAKGEGTSFALVIDGNSLALILAEESLQQEFIRVCKECSSVLCCRVSPRQKAQVTKLVRKGMGENRLCLAIGDGANDVGMIQAANVGIGITGVEGAQAAMAADYAIGQFRFLERLLLVHGHWCYRRISLMILYFFYKVCLVGWISVLCNIFTFFSGQPLYDSWYASFYNTVFTAFPIGVVGCIDQDVSAKECVKYPELYRAGHRKELFNKRLITLWLLNSLYTSLVIFFFPLALIWLAPFRSGGEVASMQEFGAILFTCLVLVPNVQLIAAVTYFTWVHHVVIWVCIALWYIFLLVYGALPVAYSTDAYKELIEAIGPSPGYWLLQPLVVVAAILPDFLVRSVKSATFPSDAHIVSEMTSNLGRQNSVSRSNPLLQQRS